MTPLIDVVPDPAHVTCLHCRLMHVEADPHRFGPPPPQNCPLGQLPQFAVSPPHPSDCCPHVPGGKLAHVVGVHELPPPHTFGVPPPPQVSLPVQVPHCKMPPHPSDVAPQFAPACAHVFGTHAGGAPHTLGTPPPPHV